MTRAVSLGGTVMPLAGVAVVVAVAVAPMVLSTYVLSLASLVLISGLLAASVNLLAGPMGLMSIGHAGISAAAGYGVAWATTHHLGVAEQLLLALLVTLAVGGIFAATTMRTSGIVFLMITLALGITVYGLTLKLSSFTGGQNGLTDIVRPALISSPQAFFYVSAATLGTALLAIHRIWRSPYGLAMRGVRDSAGRMSSLGYSVSSIRFAGVLLSSLFAGFSGVLAVWQTEFISPASSDFGRSAFAVVMVIVGGTGFLLGPPVGAAIVVGIQQWLSSYVERWPTVLGLVFIAVVLFAPTGIVGGLYRLGHRLSGRTDEARAPPEAAVTSLPGAETLPSPAVNTPPQVAEEEQT